MSNAPTQLASEVSEPIAILVVDDEPSNLVALDAVLEPLHCRIVKATSGKQALEAILEEDFAVILLDVHMPIMDGFETSEYIRSRQRSMNTPIIFLTGAEKALDQVFHGYTLGAVDYIFKPYNPDILRSKVKVFLELARLTRLHARLLHELQGKNAELEAAAQEARRAEERFRALAETASDAILSADQDGTVVYANPAAEQLFGYALAELLGQPLTRLMPERFQQAHTAGLPGYLAGDPARAVGNGVVVLAGRRKDGAEFPLELSLGEWRVQGRRFFTVIIRDITARKQMEERIRSLNENLEQRAEALASANKELEAFSYSVSHDLRAPLRSIDGFSQALLEDYAGKLDAQADDYLHRVRGATQRMAQLIDDMLQLSRVSRVELRRQEVDLSKLAQEVVAELQSREPDRKVDVRIQNGLLVEADSHLMERALENLLSNAWKFTGKTPDAAIEVGADSLEQGRAYFVRDNGAGFDMAHAGKLFGAFERLHRQDEFPGTGIGLATVQRVIQRHGGRVWADSHPGTGTTFYFTL